MDKRITAYILSALSAPLTLAGLHVLVLAVFGPRYFFNQGELWDWTDLASRELGFVMFSGTLPALAFSAPVAWLIVRRKWGLPRAMMAGAVGGLVFCLYAAANGDWRSVFDLYGPPGTGGVNLPLFYFFGSDYGNVLVPLLIDNKATGLLHILPPVISGMLTAAFFQTLIKPVAERG